MADTRKRVKGGTRVYVQAVHQPPALRGIAENLYALQQDLEVARRIQARLLPPKPQIEGYDFEAHFQPAGEVGGDFYDFLPLEGGRFAIVMADASGKGLAGALLMVEARAMVRAMASVCGSPRQILNAANRVLLRDLDRGMFVTIFIAVLEPLTGTMTMASAGHCPMLLWRARDAKVTQVSPRGLVLGAANESKFGAALAEETLVLEPGDRFLLYTDGVSELMNPVREEYGMVRLEKWLGLTANLSSERGAQSLMNALEMHRAGQLQSDDITLVVGRRMP